MKYYIYRHIRLDKEEPFYIGIGTKNEKRHRKVETEYLRAYSKDRLNSIWNKIVNKTPYEVEILLESDDYEFIKQKEREFISLYGRIDLGTGTLSNLTDGGEGVTKLSDESIKKKSERMTGENNPQWGKTKELSTNFGKPSPLKGVKQTKEHIEKRFNNLKSTYKTFIYGDVLNIDDNCPKCKYVINTSTGIIWSSIRNCAEDNNFSFKSLKSHLSGSSRSNKKYKDYEYYLLDKKYNIYEKEYTPPKRKSGCEHHFSKKVINTKTNEVLCNCKEVSKIYNIKESSLRAMLDGKRANTTDFKYLTPNS